MKLMWLLLFVVLITAIDASQKTKEILKKVQKRFRVNPHRNLKLGMELQKEKLDKKTDEEMEQFKRDQAMLIGEMIVQQQAVTEHSTEIAEKLGDLLDLELVATFCGTEKKLGYYQFRDFLFQQRKQFVQSSAAVTPIYNIEKTDRDELKFLMRFHQQNILGTTSEIEYELEAKLFAHTTHEFDYRVLKVNIGGDCPTRGKVRGPDVTYQDRMKELPEVMQVFSQVIRNDVKHVIESDQWIPMKWMESLETSKGGFKATMCSPEKTTQTEITDTEFLRLWWEKFAMMWRPYTDDNEHYITGQVAQHKPNEELVTRFTLKLSLGRPVPSRVRSSNKKPINAPEKDVHEWELMLRSEYNKKGDGLWYITAVDFACPVNLDIPKAYYETLPRLFATRIIEASARNSSMWQLGLLGLQDFMGSKGMFQYCENLAWEEPLGQCALRLYKMRVGGNSTLNTFHFTKGTYPSDVSNHHRGKVVFYVTWKINSFGQYAVNLIQFYIDVAFSPDLMFYGVNVVKLSCLKKIKMSEVGCNGELPDTECVYWKDG